MPVCGSQPAYEALNVSDYANAVLVDKPEFIATDDYLDKIYGKILAESEKF